MNLEAVQHLSGVPRYAISLLVMFQMWLPFVAIMDAHGAHTEWFAFPVPRNHRIVTCHTSYNQ